MARLSYHVSHEQHSPRHLLDLVRTAEAAGFEEAFSSDHLQPWTSAQGHSGYTWAWLGAALQSTARMKFAGITVPGAGRYPPIVVAQALGTLNEMFPGRLPWFALGSGEALNEHPFREHSETKPVRNQRLREDGELIRDLLAGRQLPNGIRIWDRGDIPPRLFGAAQSSETAATVGTWADGLLTVGGSATSLQPIATAFRERFPDKPMHAKLDLSWATSDEQAMTNALSQWRAAALPAHVLQTLRTPEAVEDAARSVSASDLRKAVFITSDARQLVEEIDRCMQIGFELIDLHNVGPNQDEFLRICKTDVLPGFQRRR